MPRRDLVEWANEAISIFDVLEDLFGIVHPRDGGSYKGHCPFEFEHPDGGLEKGFRTYPATNTAYCFVLESHGSLTPVRLVALRKELPYRRAAAWLLEQKGLLRPRAWQDRWREVMTERSVTVGHGNPQELLEALHESLRDHPAYPPGGVSPALTAAIETELSKLEGLLIRDASGDEVRAWFLSAKESLHLVLERARVGA
jgi:hypothetical protein